ncbi:Colorectal mutant cancer protein [Melipona quadrifasciata]|uniref:Colorectal mutant cancer protein n=1 Tax=Melipona quadrifasciata TaxID=166423 RepID=A0A0M8ZWG1_9HYME|nr:Colorectal mutant cancer protein [Melipona quadrifasciata]
MPRIRDGINEDHPAIRRIASGSPILRKQRDDSMLPIKNQELSLKLTPMVTEWLKMTIFFFFFTIESDFGGGNPENRASDATLMQRKLAIGDLDHVIPEGAWRRPRVGVALSGAIAQYQPRLLEVHSTPPHESRGPNQPIANFRFISISPEEPSFQHALEQTFPSNKIGLLAATRAREATEAALVRAEVQAARAEQRAEQEAAIHEERLTELHSVIAELSRQIERNRATVIAEEDESEIETSRDAEGSITNPVEESEGGGDIQGDGDRTLGDADSSCCEDIEPRTAENGREQLDSPAALPTPEPTQQAASCQSVAMAALQEEVTALRAEIASLQAQLVNFKSQAGNQRQQAGSESPRRETRGNTSSPEPLSAPCSPLLPPLQTPPTKNVTREEAPVLKIAERVRLRRTDERHITGPDITNLGVCSTMVAEHLVSDLLEHSNLQELNGSEKQFEVETERLNSRLEHARANNAVLALTLHESKAQCDRLSLLVGKYESNATALRLALSYSDRAIEAYDVLVALLESEIALSTERNSITIDNRRAAEHVAYHVLNKLENECMNTLNAPWENSIVLSDESEVAWCVEDEQRLRRHISRLKGERAMVRSTVVELESVHVEPLNSKNTISLAEARKLDLETAVLMQELMAMREDKAELRARVFLLEKERATIELKLNARDTQIAAQHAAIEHLQGQLGDTEAMLAMATNKDRGLSDNESEGMESELIEALGREARLKERLQELVSTLDKVNKNSELRHQQSAELVNDLKRANGALVQTLEKSKKKYQSRLKKLEQQMLGMVERHAAQVKSLKQRIALLEEESTGYKTSLPLQSQSSGASETSL